MKRLILTIFSLVFVLIFACKTEHPSATEEKAEGKTESPTASQYSIKAEEFKEPYKEFFYSIIDQKPEKFNSFIHPEFGLYIIESTGAMPQFSNVKDISSFRRANDKKSFYDFDLSTVGYGMLEDELPTVNCDSGPDFYSKQGAFTQSVNKFRDEKVWEHSNLSGKELDKVGELAETIMVTVVNTSNYRYYFSQFGGKWYLTFLDLRRPCQA